MNDHETQESRFYSLSSHTFMIILSRIYLLETKSKKAYNNNKSRKHVHADEVNCKNKIFFLAFRSEWKILFRDLLKWKVKYALT